MSQEKLTVVSWNTEGGLSRTGRGFGNHQQVAQSLWRIVNKVNPDLILLQESQNSLSDSPGYVVGFTEFAQSQLEKIAGENGGIFTARYEGASKPGLRDRRFYNDAMTVIWRRPLDFGPEKIQLGKNTERDFYRQAISVGMGGIAILGLHLDNEREYAREAMIEGVIRHFNGLGLPALGIGDFNAMSPQGKMHWLAKNVVGRIWPPYEPGDEASPGLLTGLAHELAGMAIGNVARIMNNAGFRDLIEGRPTLTLRSQNTKILPPWPVMGIDRAFGRDVECTDSGVLDIRGSDHRPIFVTVSKLR
jgi:endonuclease/exonuclease/phosphatase family metal-dependent hydrolase